MNKKLIKYANSDSFIKTVTRSSISKDIYIYFFSSFWYVKVFILRLDVVHKYVNIKYTVYIYQYMKLKSDSFLRLGREWNHHYYDYILIQFSFYSLFVRRSVFINQPVGFFLSIITFWGIFRASTWIKTSTYAFVTTPNVFDKFVIYLQA